MRRRCPVEYYVGKQLKRKQLLPFFEELSKVELGALQVLHGTSKDATERMFVSCVNSMVYRWLFTFVVFTLPVF